MNELFSIILSALVGTDFTEVFSETVFFLQLTFINGLTHVP